MSREPQSNHSEYDEVFKSFENSTGTDDRECLLCHGIADFETSGRLVSVDTSYWIHSNCALWSDETYLESGNLVKQIHLVFNKAKTSVSISSLFKAPKASLIKTSFLFLSFKDLWLL